MMDSICEDYCKQSALEIFEKGHEATGRKAYHPSDLLKILVYGYFNGISSSRKLERECGRNIELSWLVSGLVPDHKTISDFRRDNPLLVNGLFKYLIASLRASGFLPGRSVAIDGSKIKAYGSAQVDLDTIANKLEDIENQSDKYLSQMASLDSAEDELEALNKRKAELAQELDKLEAEKKTYQDWQKILEQRGEQKLCTTDSDAKMMRGRHGNYWAYNIQTSGNTKTHILTDIKVTNHQNDKGLLKMMVGSYQRTMGERAEQVLADGGYYTINEVEQLEQEGMHCYVAINRTASQVKDQNHGLRFQYVAQQDYYQCNEGQKLVFWRKKKINNRDVRVYRGIACTDCPKKAICTKSEARTIHRNENQPWIDGFHAKMASKEGKAKLSKRSATIEHPFATMKYYMGQIPILLRGTKKVQIEMELYAIGYNLKRYFNLLTNNKGLTTTATIPVAV